MAAVVVPALSVLIAALGLSLDWWTSRSQSEPSASSAPTVSRTGADVVVRNLSVGIGTVDSSLGADEWTDEGVEVTVTFENLGDRSALVTSVSGDVLYSEALYVCLGQGGRVFASEFPDLPLDPGTLKEPPDDEGRVIGVARQPRDFEIPAGQIEAMGLTLGNGTKTVPYVSVVELRATIAGDEETEVDLGTVALVSPLSLLGDYRGMPFWSSSARPFWTLDGPSEIDDVDCTSTLQQHVDVLERAAATHAASVADAGWPESLAENSVAEDFAELLERYRARSQAGMADADASKTSTAFPVASSERDECPDPTRPPELREQHRVGWDGDTAIGIVTGGCRPASDGPGWAEVIEFDTGRTLQRLVPDPERPLTEAIGRVSLLMDETDLYVRGTVPAEGSTTTVYFPLTREEGGYLLGDAVCWGSAGTVPCGEVATD
ncbi:hypothetical protein Q6350_00285 [Isoptericola sp. b515]|uniref:hypothetical protein n=1 Tax=Isoptericola sp. b515 TaxID=3064652 RepID=UPI002713BFC7|nr:hypothetical protein [Isoptericola sp. b515]MDO8146862.1 hypothetical protein [Isoptericola sp. b515]